MAKRRAWADQPDETVFVERPDGGRDIIRNVGGEKRVYETQPSGGSDGSPPPEPDDDG